MAPPTQLWQLFHGLNERLTIMEPRLQTALDVGERVEARQLEFEKEVRNRFETMNESIHAIRVDQRVSNTKMAFYFGILAFLGATIGGWFIKTSLDSVRAAIVQNHNEKP